MELIKKQTKYLLVLHSLFLFEEINRQLIAEVFARDDCVCYSFESGETVYSRDHFEKSIGVVVSGQLKAVKQGADGNTTVLNNFFQGGVFGVATLFHKADHYVSDIVAVKRSRVLFLPQNLLQDIFRQDIRIAENYISYLSGRICFLNARIDSFTGGTANYRLAGFLLSQSEQQDGSLQFELPCTLTTLSESLNIGRASLYRALDDFVSQGIIERTGRKVRIVDLDRLQSGQF